MSSSWRRGAARPIHFALRRSTASARKTPPGPTHNWCENVALTHSKFVHPENLAELQRAVARASRARVLGSAHSFSALCRSDETLISLAFMRRVLAVDVHHLELEALQRLHLLEQRMRLERHLVEGGAG